MSDTASSPITLEDTRCLGMLTDVGRVRNIDEDSIMASEISFAINSQNYSYRLLVVADGMGGHARGEEASKIALAAISRTILSGLFDSVSLTKLLNQAIQNANQDILAHTKNHPESLGMGTTVVCALINGSNVYVANVGDSRAYAVSNDEIRRITKDHSYVQELMDAGEITEKETRIHPKKNIITKAVGIEPLLEPDLIRFTLDSDESLLLCCDGVIAHLTDDDICKIVINSENPQNACQKIVDVANERGGSDNISLIILTSPSKNDEPDDDIPTIING